MTKRTSRGRFGLALVVVLGAVVAFATVGGTGLAGSLAKPAKAQYGKGQYNNPNKVWVCHRKGNGGSVTIRVSINALPAHLAHGDTQGLCPAVTAIAATKAKKAKKTDETTQTTAPSTSGKSNNGKAKGKNK